MPLNKKQLIRLVKLVSELKQNRYPNCQSFAEKLLASEFSDNVNIACGPKTIYRDIKILKEDFSAPIEFDSGRNGYYLTHHGWNFEYPVLMENQMLSAVFGGKIAESIVPDPLKTEIKNAVDSQLTTNNPDFLDTAFMESFIIASGVKVTIDAAIFKALFDAWITHHSVKIKHIGVNGKESAREIEPHAIVYLNSVWYIRGICLLKNEERVFAIHRIKQAQPTEKTFVPDQKIIEATRKELFKYNKLRNVKILCMPEIAGYVMERNKAPGDYVEVNKDGSVTISFAEIAELEVVKWVLSEGGMAKVVSPPELARKIVSKAEKIIKMNTAGQTRT